MIGLFVAIALQATAPPLPEKPMGRPRIEVNPVAPAAPRGWTSRPTFAGPKRIDIPQWAKDAGHNGAASYRATVDAEGKLIGLTLTRSSQSEAIDAAARATIERGRFTRSYGADGKPVGGEVDIRLEYAPWREAEGGIEGYRCGNLVRDYGWFSEANRQTQRIFWLENAFVSRHVVSDLQAERRPTREERAARRATETKVWADLIKRCRRKPDDRMIDHVPDRALFLGLATSF